MLVSLGVVQGAVEVYQRLELWEEVATCYQAAGRKGRAEEVVRERLREHETPTLWCILGDVTQVCVEREGEREEEGREGRGWRERGSVGEWLKSTLASLCRIPSATGKLGSSPAIAVAGHRGL